MELLYQIFTSIISILVIYYTLIVLRIILHRVFGILDNATYVKRVMIIFGSGGHTTEMLLMLKKLEF